MKSRKIIKVCGMLHRNNIRDVYALDLHWIGFIFYPPSPRYVKNVKNKDVIKSLNDIKKVGVFVNEDVANIKTEIDDYGLHMVQLHGEESVEQCKELQEQLDVIKVFSMDEDFDFSITEPYDGHVTFFLFDTKTKDYGGSGKKFPWSILKNYTGSTPFLLSGGIGPQDVNILQELHHEQFAGVDLNSRFECHIAMKRIGLLQDFVIELRKQEKWPIQ